MSESGGCEIKHACMFYSRGETTERRSRSMLNKLGMRRGRSAHNVLIKPFWRLPMALQDTLQALSDPTRRQILNMLKGGKKTAGEIAEAFEISGPAISRHLTVLKNADLIRDRRDGKFIIYELSTSVLEEIMMWVKDLKETPKGEK